MPIFRLLRFSSLHKKLALLTSNSICKQWMKSHFVEMPLQNPIYYLYLLILSAKKFPRHAKYWLTSFLAMTWLTQDLQCCPALHCLQRRVLTTLHPRVPSHPSAHCADSLNYLSSRILGALLWCFLNCFLQAFCCKQIDISAKEAKMKVITFTETFWIWCLWIVLRFRIVLLHLTFLTSLCNAQTERKNLIPLVLFMLICQADHLVSISRYKSCLHLYTH